MKSLCLFSIFEYISKLIRFECSCVFAIAVKLQNENKNDEEIVAN